MFLTSSENGFDNILNIFFTFCGIDRRREKCSNNWRRCDSKRTNIVQTVTFYFTGIGGTSAAFFLRQKISNKANIELIDDKEGLGGRVATVHVPSVRRDYEIGGSIIHSSNKLMTDFLDICDMKKKASPPDAPFTLHKDGEIVFQVILNLHMMMIVHHVYISGMGIPAARQSKNGFEIWSGICNEVGIFC